MAREEPPQVEVGRATLSDVARLAGVSLATASRALHGAHNRTVDPALQARVIRVADELRYAANVSARAIAQGSSRTIGVMVSTIADPYFSFIAEGAVSAAEARGFNVVVSVTKRDLDREVALAHILRGKRVRGIILVEARSIDEDTSSPLKAEFDDFAATGGRVVVLSENRLGLDSVLVENYRAAHELGSIMLDYGYRRFLVLAGPADLFTAKDRAQGFVDAVLESTEVRKGDVAVVHSGFTRDGAIAAMTDLGPERLRGVQMIYAISDVMALGTLSVLRDWGVSVPGDVALAGFNDIETLKDVVPGITTVRLPLLEMGGTAVEVVLREDSGPPVERLLPAEVIVRASTPRREQ